MSEARPPAAALDELARLGAAGGPGAAPALRRLAALTEAADPDRAAAALRRLARLEPLDPAPRLALARLAAERGDLAAAAAEAEAVLNESVDQAGRARAAFILGEIARVSGQSGAARAAYETTRGIEEEILRANPGDPTATRWYARARGRLAELQADGGDLAGARTGAEGALALLRACAAQISETPVLAADIADAEMRLAALEMDLGAPVSARRRLGEAIGRYEALAVTEKDEPHWRAVLSDAWALAAEADYLRHAPADARAAMDKALQARIKLAAADPGENAALAGTWRVRAALLAALNDMAGASEALTQASALARRLNTGGDAAARLFVHTLLDQADHALRCGAPALARDAADEARAVCEQRAQAAHTPEWLGDCGAAWDRLGEAARQAGARDKAFEGFTRAAEFRRLARDAAKDNPRFTRGLAAALVKLGDAALAANAAQTARAALTESTNLRLDLAEAAPDDLTAVQALATALERLGLAAKACGDTSAARAAWEDELSLAERIFEPGALEGVRFRAIVLSHLAGIGDIDARHAALQGFDALAKAGALSEAEAALRKRLWGSP